MKSKDKQIYLLGLVVAVFVVCYALFFPQHIYIADEISYINRLLTLVDIQNWTDVLNQQPLPFILADYPLGTSFFLVPFYWLFGYDGIYVANIFFVLASMTMIYFTIKQVNPNRASLAAYTLLCSPVLFFSHVIMSELPSLLIMSTACYFLYKKNQSQLDLLFIGLCVGLSIWFRETNAIILLIPIIVYFKKDFGKITVITIGFLLGLLPRLLSAWLIYGDAFFIKDAGYGFSLSHMGENLPLYSINLIFLFPLILYPLIQIKTSAQRLIGLSVLAFVLIHLCYGYNGIKASGIKAILLTSRFLIPLMPLFVLSIVLVNKKWMDRLNFIIPWLAVTFTIGFHLLLSMNNQSITKYKTALQAVNSPDNVFLFDAEDPEILELLTPIQAKNPLRIAAINHADSTHMKLPSRNNYFIIEQRRTDTRDRSEKQAKLDQKLANSFSTENLELVSKIDVGYQTLLLWRLIN